LGREFSSELQVAFALTVAAAALASSVALLASIAAMRLWRRYRQSVVASREEGWRSAMYVSMEVEAAQLPRVSWLDLAAFLRVFNHIQESVRGDAADTLARSLAASGYVPRLIAMLDGRSPKMQLIAITALGHMREERAWDRLDAISRGRGPVTSFAAARAMLRIEPRRALERLGPSIIARADWPIARIATIFQELGPAVVTPAVVNWLLARPRQNLERAVKLARFAHRHRVASIVRGWLAGSDRPEIIVAALEYVEQEEDLPLARGAARHPEWRVRMAAAITLARVGGPRELSVLLELLRDPVWWVRYHAAQALTRLEGLEPGELERLREDARDAYAADMLAHALAEAKWR
jgi:hypothetical protein